MDDDFSHLDDSFEEVLLSDHELHLRQPFRLFDLPAEIWLRVCEFAVVKPGAVVLGRQKQIRDQVATVRQPAITRTCRLIRRETLPLFYSSNEFQLYHLTGIPCPRAWITAIGKLSQANIQTLTIYTNCDQKFWRRSFRSAGIDAELEGNRGQVHATVLQHGVQNQIQVKPRASEGESSILSIVAFGSDLAMFASRPGQSHDYDCNFPCLGYYRRSPRLRLELSHFRANTFKNISFCK